MCVCVCIHTQCNGHSKSRQVKGSEAFKEHNLNQVTHTHTSTGLFLTLSIIAPFSHSPRFQATYLSVSSSLALCALFPSISPIFLLGPPFSHRACASIIPISIVPSLFKKREKATERCRVSKRTRAQTARDGVWQWIKKWSEGGKGTVD